VSEYWEYLAVALGIAYVVLAARESIWCWPAAFISTAIYTVLFWEGALPMQSLLNAYYLAMAVYGFWAWRRHDQSSDDLHIHTWSVKNHLLFIGAGAVLTVAIAQWMAASDYSRFPWLDAGVTVFSVMTTVLMARKVLENWLYWVVIDLAAVWLYIQSGYTATAGMFALYTVLAIAGYWNWRRLYGSGQ